MTAQLPFPLLSALAWATLVNALVPADPTITSPAILPRQNNDRYIGWVENNGTWISEVCNTGLTWYQAGKYAQCCPTTLASCYAPTACVDGSLIYPYSDYSTTSTIACTENFDNVKFSICNTAFIFENTGDSNPKTDIVCGESSVNWSYYRVIPDSFTQTSSPTSTIPESKPPGSVVTGPPTTPTEPPKAKKSSSKAWIAGAVIGPILGLALIGGIIFLLFSRKKKPIQPPQQHAAPAVVPGAPQPPVAQYNNDVKPGYPSQPSPGGTHPNSAYYANDPYNQQAYSPQPLSPAPQYTAPYSAPGSPPPQGYPMAQSPPPQKVAMMQDSGEVPQPMAAELGGTSNPVGGEHTAELEGGAVSK
ncbi:uncharacterized protein BDR25DRAFT_306759 [Lindgomyces ingoldianus]|uniref:Uncharacterized protein n=1 Tax=Lindgomyces ingoldianus TaxID=673940 RepID=A0ACB6QEA6_9PLEO|nr:uncharacterized protein BDR25DRAFT_306759 [Lindgomyces ingoldianus]KAF2465319.1 hypothetical protein BDR25DRAFT_306759 [Lindgomyces ingoldianus]